MERIATESWAGKLRAKIDQWLGLPPGKPPDLEVERAEEEKTPHGTLTAADAEGLPPHGGSGISVE